MPILRGHGSLAGPLPEPPGPWEQPAGPKTVQHFREMLGFCGHAQWINVPSVYDPLSNWKKVVDLAVDAGISWHRTGIPVGPNAISGFSFFLKQKHDYSISKGLKLTLEIPGYWSDADSWYGTPEQQIDYIDKNFPKSAILAFETVNEPDLFHSENGNWPGMLADHMVEVQRAVRKRPQFDDIPILGPGLCFDTAGQLAAAFTAKGIESRDVMDLYTPHPYDGGDMPKLGHYVSERNKYQPLKRNDGPPWITEWGYYTALQTGDYAPVDERTQAVYLLKGWATQFLFGCRHSSMYVFVDTQTSTNNSENNFGMVRSDWTLKPSFTALKNLTTFLGPKTAPIVATTKPYTITGPSDLRHFQIQRADGTFVVFVWRETLVWNRDARTPITVAPQNVTINQSGTVYNPVTDVTSSTTGTFPVDGDLYLVSM